MPCRDMADPEWNRFDAGSIVPILARFLHIMDCLKGHYIVVEGNVIIVCDIITFSIPICRYLLHKL